MARSMRDENDLADVVLPGNASASRQLQEERANNDVSAQSNAAAMLAYSVHGGNCAQCGNANSEGELCRVGTALYANMRSRGLVG